MPTAKMEKANHREAIAKWFQDSADMLAALAKESSSVEKAAALLIKAYQNGGKMVLFGNGGSAADAQHLATELLGGLMDHKRKSLPALALTTDTSALTAIGNDYDFDTIFSRQVESMVKPKDVVIAISTSGNSANVLKGAQAAKKIGATVIGFTGAKGGQLRAVCNLAICVPSTETSHIQEAHIAIGHILCVLVEKAMAGAH